MKTRYNYLINFILVLISIFLSLLATEALLKNYVFDPSRFYIRTPGWSMQVKHNGKIDLNKISDDHIVSINHLGYRGSTPNLISSPRIILIGGSTVEDWAMSDEDMYSNKLQNIIRQCNKYAYVGNLGKSGVNARSNLLQLDKTYRYLPKFDEVVILMGLNDFLYDQHIHHPQVSMPESWFENMAFMSVPSNYKTSSAIVELFRRIKNIDKDRAPLINNMGDNMEELWRAYSSRSVKEKSDMPNLLANLDLYEKTILKLNSQSQAMNRKITFVTQPYLWANNLDDVSKKQLYAGFIGSDPRANNVEWYSMQSLQKGLAAYNSRLLSVCERYKLNCIDLALTMTDSSLFYDDFHFSKQGGDHIAEVLGEKLKQDYCN
jgi:hypothetical protein